MYRRLTFFADHLLESLLVARRPARVVVKQLGVKGIPLFGNVVAQLPLCLFRLQPFFPTPAARDRPDSLD